MQARNQITEYRITEGKMISYIDVEADIRRMFVGGLQRWIEDSSEPKSCSTRRKKKINLYPTNMCHFLEDKFDNVLTKGCLQISQEGNKILI